MKFFNLIKITAGLTLIINLILVNFPFNLDRLFQRQVGVENFVTLGLFDFLEDVDNYLESHKPQKIDLQKPTYTVRGRLSDNGKNSVQLENGSKGDKLILSLDFQVAEYDCYLAEVTFLEPKNRKLDSEVLDSGVLPEEVITLRTDGDYRIKIIDKDDTTCDHPEFLQYSLTVENLSLLDQDYPY